MSAILARADRKTGSPRNVPPALAAVLLFCMWIGTGCETDDSYYDHRPPEGQGSLVVVNDASVDVDLYVDGQEIGRVRDGSDRTVDLDPGVYRVVLKARSGDRSFRDDIDILVGELSILHVADDYDRSDRFRVWFEFD